MAKNHAIGQNGEWFDDVYTPQSLFNMSNKQPCCTESSCTRIEQKEDT